jgi:tRNA (cytidine/uridine-2'-O-)-methyltransferase
MRLALFQPDIPQNTGALMRIGACFRVPVDIIEPCGFPLDDKRLRRTAMDYGEGCMLERHSSWEAFQAATAARGGRLVLLTTHATASFADFAYGPADVLLLGRESAGVPDFVVSAVAARVRIPMAQEQRSLNVAVSGAIVLAEGLRQMGILSGKTVL